jgi:putative ABC transport system permease protein
VSLTRFLRRSYWDDERTRELEAHLAIETDMNIARGMAPADARRAAERKLGNRTLVREDIYEMNTVNLVEAAWRDVRYGARMLRRNPSFAIVAILSLALGIGANTAIFQLLDAVRLRTLPVQAPQQLVDIRVDDNGHGRTGQFSGRVPELSHPLFEQIRARQESFSGLAAWGTMNFNLTSTGEARYARGIWVNGDFFSTLGVTPLLGRMLAPEDDVRGCASPRTVVSYGFWQRELGGDASAIGRPLLMEGHNYEIVGVAPAQFFGLEVGRAFDVAVPLCAEPLARARSGLDKPDVWFLGIFARLKPGWTMERAQSQLAAISPSIFQTTLPPRYRPEDATNYLAFKLTARPAGTGISSLRRDYEAPLWLLLATTGLVLVIACANLANLMLARATAREREIAVRLAIGASRSRIARQLLAESLLLSAIGAAGGLIVARWLSAFLVGFLRTDANRLFLDLATDWRVFAFTGGLAVVTCLIFGLTPAIRATSTQPGAAMKAGSRGGTDSRERFSVRRGLVVVQVALSLVLVVGALMFVRSLRNLMILDAGFRQDGLLAVSIDVRRSGLPAQARPAAFSDVTSRVRAIPGVNAASEAFIVPMSGSGWNNRIVIDGKTFDDRKYNVNFNSVGRDYFRTMGTPLVAGRDFNDHDRPGTPKVAIVTQQFAKTFFGGQSPIGRRFQIEEGVGVERPLIEIVGLVKDAKYFDLREEFSAIAFLAAAQEREPDPELQLVVRSNAPLASVTGAITAVVASAQPSAALQFQTMNTLVRDSLTRERLMATLSGFFGLLAGLLATIGLYGVMSYMVERRRNEIGIRIALGADRRSVVAMIMREAAALLVAGLIVGVAAAIGAAQWARTLLFGLTPSDPATLVAASVGLSVVALLAGWIPAWRASRLEPTLALREE